MLMEGIVFGESPRWHDGRLWFSDWGANQVIALDPGGGHEVVASVPSFPMCIDFLPDGRLLVVDSAQRRVLRREPDGSLVTHADLAARLGEAVERHRGRRARQRLRQQHRLRLPRRGVRAGLRRARHAGRCRPPGRRGPRVPQRHGDHRGRRDADRRRVLRQPAHGVRDRPGRRAGRPAGLGGRRDDHPDGICVDAEGAVWYADVGNRHCVRVREGGEVVATVELDRGAFACALSRGDRPQLYVVGQEWGGSEADGADRAGRRVPGTCTRRREAVGGSTTASSCADPAAVP